jgi:hypothetical protein
LSEDAYGRILNTWIAAETLAPLASTSMPCHDDREIKYLLEYASHDAKLNQEDSEQLSTYFQQFTRDINLTSSRGS